MLLIFLQLLNSRERERVVSYWQKYVQEVLINRLGGLSLPRKSVVRITDHPDMTLDVTVDVKQQHNNISRHVLAGPFHA